MTTSIAIIADFNSESESHAATSRAVSDCAAAQGLVVEPRWIPTITLATTDGLKQLAEFDGFWIGPGSPYRSTEGALSAIRIAREERIPLLGTCGGFQHIILEYARNVLGFEDAEHEESAPHASRLFISRLACSLVGRAMTISLVPESLVARSYGQTIVAERYYCNFGVNPQYLDKLRSGALKVVGSDTEGEIRSVELPDHPFFVGTLFLPQLNSTATSPHPLVIAFLKACARRREHQ